MGIIRTSTGDQQDEGILRTWTAGKQENPFDWNEPKNWGPEGSPEAKDDLIIPWVGTEKDPRGPAVPGEVGVRSLELGGVLQGSSRLAVSGVKSADQKRPPPGRVLWTKGRLDGGLKVGKEGTVTIIGPEPKSLGGLLNLPRGQIEGAPFGDPHSLGLHSGAMLIVEGDVYCGWETHLRWTGGASPSFQVTEAGTLHVLSGTLAVSDGMFHGRGVVDISDGATMALMGSLHVLARDCRVEGSGRLLLLGDGRLFAEFPAYISEGSILELSHGEIVGKRFIGGTEQLGHLTVYGQLHWTGGNIAGDVTLGPNAVLRIDGPDSHIHTGGQVRLVGSGAVMASTDLRVDKGQLIIEKGGDLLLQSPLDIQEGRGWRLENHGTLRVGGRETVRLGNNSVDNRGAIDVTEGALHLGTRSDRFTQQADGSLNLAAGAIVQCDAQLRVGGAVTGFGTVVGSIEVDGTLVPGSPPDATSAAGRPGRLTVEGSCRLTARAQLRSRIDGATAGDEYSQLQVNGPVELDGSLRADAPASFTPQAERPLELVRTIQSSPLRGRFRRVTLPRPVGGQFLRVHYSRHAAQLVTSTNVAGVDASKYPGDDFMREVTSHPEYRKYRWVGYYLQTTYHSDRSWLRKRAFLADTCKLGTAILYFGRQQPAHGLTAAAGRQDAEDAVKKTEAEHFKPGSWIYLDVEWSQGGINHDKATYVEAWAAEMLRLGVYSPAIYCPSQDVPVLSARVTNVFIAAGRADRPRFWVASLCHKFEDTLPPAESGVPEAVAWQQEYTGRNCFPPPIKLGVSPQDRAWEVDYNVSVLADPSAPGE